MKKCRCIPYGGGLMFCGLRSVLPSVSSSVSKLNEVEMENLTNVPQGWVLTNTSRHKTWSTPNPFGSNHMSQVLCQNILYKGKCSFKYESIEVHCEQWLYLIDNEIYLLKFFIFCG